MPDPIIRSSADICAIHRPICMRYITLTCNCCSKKRKQGMLMQTAKGKSNHLSASQNRIIETSSSPFASDSDLMVMITCDAW
jgi:hypothetical protein